MRFIRPDPGQKKIDHTLLAIMIILIVLGLITLFSATYYKAQDGGDSLSEVKKQLFGPTACGESRGSCWAG